jgi:hypothetical protein
VRPRRFEQRGTALLALIATLGSACAAAQQRELARESRALGRAVARADGEATQARLFPSARATLDKAALQQPATARIWGEALQRPTSVRPEGVVLLGPEDVAEVVWTDDGWRFASDPSDHYAQGTPREALTSLVRASRLGRWDRLVELAPRRYRIGLSAQDLERAWTRGERAAELGAARDRLARHLSDPIRSDAHEAVLDLGEGRAARCEREGDRWVVVDF